MQPLKWFHRGTAPMVAIYPDDGSGGLYPMSRAQGLRPVRWTHNGTGFGMAIYPGDTDGTIRALPEVTRDPGLAPVHWFHEGRYPMTVNFNDEYPPAGGGEEYEGPLDVNSTGIKAAYSLRALSAAWRGENVCRLRRGSDDAEIDFACDASDGSFPDAAAIAWRDAAGATDAFVVTLYDQSGGGIDVTQSTPGNQPKYASNQINGQPGLLVNGASCGLTSAAGTLSVASGAFTSFAVSIGSNRFNLQDINNGTPYVKTTTGASAEVVSADSGENNSCGGNYAAEISDNEYILVDAAWQFGSRNMKENGANVTLAFDNDFGGPLGELTGLYVDIYITNDNASNGMAEFLSYDGAKSDPDRLALRQNIADYYGITLP